MERRVESRPGALQDVVRAVSAAPHVEQVVAEVVRRVPPLVGADRAAVYLVEPGTGDLVSRAADGADITIRLARGKGLAGWVAEHRRPLRVDDAYEDPRFVRVWDQASGRRTRAMVCVPLISSRGALVGVLACADRRGGFRLADQELLEGVAGPVANALDNLQLAVAMLERSAQLGMISELERDLSEADSAPDAMVRALGALRRSTGAAAAVGLLVQGPESHLWVARGSRCTSRSLTPAAAGSLLERLAETPPRSLLPRTDPAGEVVTTAPLEHHGRRLGGVQVAGEHDPHVVSLAAGRLAQALGRIEERARRERDQRLAMVGQMMSGIVHDLRGPMSSALGYVDLLSDEDDPVERRRFVRHVTSAIRQMDEMVHEVLQFARGRSDVAIEPTELAPFLGSLVDLVGPDLDRYGAELVLAGQLDGWVPLDEARMRRVLTNLVRNAGQAGARHVTVEVGLEGAAATILVRDDGAGIPEAARARLFEPFETHGKDGGTGLGLAMARRIVEEHGGRLELVSTGPRGTTFRIWLPLAADR